MENTTISFKPFLSLLFFTGVFPTEYGEIHISLNSNCFGPTISCISTRDLEGYPPRPMPFVRPNDPFFLHGSKIKTIKI